jgi:hypothetical protein
LSILTATIFFNYLDLVKKIWNVAFAVKKPIYSIQTSVEHLENVVVFDVPQAPRRNNRDQRSSIKKIHPHIRWRPFERLTPLPGKSNVTAPITVWSCSFRTSFGPNSMGPRRERGPIELLRLRHVMSHVVVYGTWIGV